MSSDTNNLTCPICFNEEDSEKNPFTSLPCNCKACNDCLTQWITLKISENRYTIDSKTTCFMSNCKNDLCLQDIYQRMPLSSQQKMDEALLQVYLSKEKGIRKCPNSNCKYAGIIDTKSSCNSPLQCSLCGTEWREKQNETKFEKIKNLFNNTAQDPSETWIKQKSKRCPSCSAPIEKNGGCDHMICRNCNFRFCWVCRIKFIRHLGPIHFYRENPQLMVAALVVLSLITYAFYSLGMISILQFFVVNFFGIIYQFICFCFSVFYFFVYGFFYILWNFGLSILNFIVANGFVLVTWAIISGKRIPFLIRMKGIFAIFAFVWVSVSFGYFSTLLGILKTEIFTFLVAGSCVFALTRCIRLPIR